MLSAVASPYVLLFLTMLFWSGNAVVRRGMVGSVPPVGLAFWRWTVALAILLPFGFSHLWAARHSLVKAWPVVTALSVLGVTVFNTLYYLALTATTAINATVVSTTAPAVIPVVAWIAYRERFSPRQALGLAIAAIGVAAVILRGDLRAAMEMRFNDGDLIILLSVLVWAVYSILLRRLPAGLHPLALLTATFAVGLVFLVPLYGWELSTGAEMRMAPQSFLAIAYTGVFPSILAFLCWNQAVAAVGPNTAGLFLYLMPVLTSLLAVTFLGEVIRPYHLIGAALVISGIHVATRQRHPARNGEGQ
ncbi:MAG: DMT family transporter [Rhodospirillales bacterium]|nr:DMT family transporter [Rhodospirillales bacterium]